MKLISNNHLNELADQLISELLANHDDFFSYTTIVCPNRNVRQWFKGYWLNNRKEILMNVNFVNLEEYLFSIFDTDLQLAGSSDIKNLLIKLLSSKDYDHTFKDIRDYLFDDVNGTRVINATKLYELASTLTSLFADYEKEEFVSDSKFTGWEKELYDSLLVELENNQLTTLSKLFKDKTPIKKQDKKVYLFGFLSLDKLHLDTLSICDNVVLYQLELSKTLHDGYKITSSPSISKEIEVVHSKICELLKDNSNKPTDFLVIGNGMSGYENIIKKTFNQDDVNFPYIPYSISGSKSDDSDLTLALKLLVEIINKGFFTRLDFFSLISNKLIKSVRGIEDDQIEKWMECIYTLNVYRGDASDNDDWDYIRKRILLSKISDVSFDDNLVVMNGEDTIPYSSIGLDNDSIIKLVSLIDDFSSWFDLFSKVSFTDKDSLVKLKAELKKWFCHSELKYIDKRYKKVDDLITYWVDKDIVAPLNTLLFLLLDASKMNSISYREPFTTGVTFVELNENVAYAQKYVFFINCGSNALPTKKIKSELDLRPDFDMNKKEKEAFLYQYQNGGQVFLEPYDKDKTILISKFKMRMGGIVMYFEIIETYPAELFDSTYSREIRTEIIKKKNPNTQILSSEKYDEVIEKKVNDFDKYNIDETRPWKELYSRGEYNKKDYREGLLSIKVPHSTQNSSLITNPDGEKQEIRTKITTGDLASLLEEPLSARAKYLFGRQDVSNEENHKEFEQFSIDTLENYLIVSVLAKMEVKHVLENPGVNFDTSRYKEQLELENKLPHLNEKIKDLNFELECLNTGKVLSSIGVIENPSEYDTPRLEDLQLNCNGINWTLICNKSFLRKESGNVIDYYEFKVNSEKKPLIKFLQLYIISLMDIASRNNQIEYTINLHRFAIKTFTLTSKDSVEILNKLFSYLNNYCDPYFAYLDFAKSKVKSFNKLVEHVYEDHGPWSFFAFGKLFNPDTELGYDRLNYKEDDYYNNQNEMAEKIKFVDQFVPDPGDAEEDD